MSTRRHEWPELLAAYVAERRRAPFEWGTHDCCKFAAGAVEAITGENPMHAIHYTNEIGALRLIAEAGGQLESLVTAFIGQPLPTIAQAKRGDVVLSDLGNGPTVGVCLGATSAYAAPVGLLMHPTAHARLAWRIG